MTALTADEMALVLRDDPRGVDGVPKTLPQVLRTIYESIGASPFTPGEAGDWDIEGVLSLQAALDQLATRMTTVEGLVGSVAGLLYTPDAPTDWDPVPTLLQDAVDQLAARVEVLEP